MHLHSYTKYAWKQQGALDPQHGNMVIMCIYVYFEALGLRAKKCLESVWLQWKTNWKFFPIEENALVGGFIFFSILTPKIVEDSHFDEHIFQRGWFNHQLDAPLTLSTRLPSPPFFCSQAFAAVEQRELRAKVLPGNGWNPPHDEC